MKLLIAMIYEKHRKTSIGFYFLVFQWTRSTVQICQRNLAHLLLKTHLSCDIVVVILWHLVVISSVTKKGLTVFFRKFSGCLQWRAMTKFYLCANFQDVQLLFHLQKMFKMFNYFFNFKKYSRYSIIFSSSKRYKK